jgi:hypothetical protein
VASEGMYRVQLQGGDNITTEGQLYPSCIQQLALSSWDLVHQSPLAALQLVANGEMAHSQRATNV